MKAWVKIRGSSMVEVSVSLAILAVLIFVTGAMAKNLRTNATILTFSVEKASLRVDILDRVDCTQTVTQPCNGGTKIKDSAGNNIVSIGSWELTTSCTPDFRDLYWLRVDAIKRVGGTPVRDPRTGNPMNPINLFQERELTCRSAQTYLLDFEEPTRLLNSVFAGCENCGRRKYTVSGSIEHRVLARAPTGNKLCNLLGYRTLAALPGGSFSGCGDNRLARWNAAANVWDDIPACSDDWYISGGPSHGPSIRCSNPRFQ